MSAVSEFQNLRIKVKTFLSDICSITNSYLKVRKWEMISQDMKNINMFLAFD